MSPLLPGALHSASDTRNLKKKKKKKANLTLIVGQRLNTQIKKKKKTGTVVFWGRVCV